MHKSTCAAPATVPKSTEVCLRRLPATRFVWTLVTNAPECCFARWSSRSMIAFSGLRSDCTPSGLASSPPSPISDEDGTVKAIDVSRVFITGSTDGLGLAAALTLVDEGHEVVFHARSAERASAIEDLKPRSLSVVVGDLASDTETRSVADQVNRIGRMNAIIHNAGIYREASRRATPEGHASILAINTLAPYLLTALIKRPDRLIYLSSGMHQGGGGPVDDIDWKQRPWNATRAYSESKLHVATIAAAVARNWPDVVSNAVDPGWVPTKMGGAGAPDDFQMGYQTQTWLATSDDEKAKISGAYWFHRQHRQPAAQVTDPEYQDMLVAKLQELTGVRLFDIR